MELKFFYKNRIKIVVFCIITFIIGIGIYFTQFYIQTSFEKTANIYFKNSDYSNALKYYKRLSQKKLLSSTDIINKAVCESKLGKYTDSLKTLDLAEKAPYIKNNSNYLAQIYMLKASGYYSTNQNNESIHYLKMAQNIIPAGSPLYFSTQVQLINNYFLLNNAADCISVLNSIKSSNQNNKDKMFYYYYAIGQVYDYMKKDYDNAIINYNNAVNLKPSQIDIYIKISNVYLKQGNNDLKKQLSYLKSVQKNIKNNPTLNNYINDVENSLKNYNEFMKNSSNGNK